MKTTPESWLPVPGYQGKYLISTQGNIRKGSLNTITQPLSIRIDRAGYKTTRFCNNNQIESVYIHRLVAAAFVPNPHGKPFVNHKDGNKLNNAADNFEWTTHSENVKHAYDTGLISKYRQSKKVVDLCSGKQFNSAREAAEMTHIPYSTLKNYLNGQRPNPTCLQYAFEFSAS